MEEMEIELQDGIKVVIKQEVAKKILLEKLGLTTLEKKTSNDNITPSKKEAFQRTRKGKNIEKVMGFLKKHGEITGPELTKIMGKGGSSYVFMAKLVAERTVIEEPNNYPKKWLYLEGFDGKETGFEKQADEMSERIANMQRAKAKKSFGESKTCNYCGEKFYKTTNLTDYLWKIKKYCGEDCQHSYNNEKLKANRRKPTTRNYTKHKEVRVSKKKHCMTKQDVLNAIKSLDNKGIKSDLKGIARELNYYSNNIGRISTHVWSLKKERLVVAKDDSVRGAEYTANANLAKARKLSKKLGIKKVVIKEPEEKNPSVGWVRETLADDRAYYLIESCIYGRTIKYEDANIMGLVNTTREWNKFGANVLTHQADIIKQYNAKGLFQWNANQKALKFNKK